MRIVLDLSPEDVMSANDRPTHWANTALRLDAAADLPRVLDALGLREAS